MLSKALKNDIHIEVYISKWVILLRKRRSHIQTIILKNTKKIEEKKTFLWVQITISKQNYSYNLMM